MANGILKDEATYYGDTTTYIGDGGSSTNKYVIEDCYDFITAASLQYSSGAYMRLVNDIDFNEHSTYKRGFNNISFGAGYNRYLYGDGHKIKNLVIINSNSVFTFIRIERCDFVNLVQISCDEFPIYLYGGGNTGTMYNCNFGMHLSDTPFNLAGVYNDCTFNVKGSIKNGVGFIGKITQCHFNFDISADGDGKSLFWGNYDSFDNSYVTGRLVYPNASQLFNSYFRPTNSYFAFEYSGDNQITNSNDYANTCFIDKELFEKNGATLVHQDKIKALTTAQAQDADYLNSIGFLVIPVE